MDKLNESSFPQYRWKELGLKLGLFIYSLKLIENDNKQNTDCFIECLSAWLEGKDKVKEKQTRSWKSLAVALGKMELNDVAAKIRKMCDIK